MQFTLRNIAVAVLWRFAVTAVMSAPNDQKPICLMYLTGQVVFAQCYQSGGNQRLTRVTASTMSFPSIEDFSSL